MKLKNQLERLQYVCNKIKNKKDFNFDKLSIFEKICFRQLEIIEKRPEYIDKLDHFFKKDFYCTSNNDVVIFAKID